MSEMNQCVQRKMKLLSEEDSPLSLKQRLGKAFGICKKKLQGDMIHDFADQIRYDIDPMELVDSDTGIGIHGNIVDDPIGVLVPVASTDVRAVGTFGTEVLAQFHDTPNTYRYNVGSVEKALEVYQSFLNAGSKGKWLWKNFRGHVKGESTVGKWGPSFFRGIPTIGGTSASLEPYDISGRSPIPKLGGFKAFEKVAKQLKGFKQDPSSLVGKPITGSSGIDVARRLAKMGKFKSTIQIRQSIKELQARQHLKSLQPGNIIKGVL